MKLTAAQTNAWFAEHLATMDLTQDEFCEINHMSKSDLSRYKQQKAHPGSANLEKLAAGFGVDVISMLIALGAIDADAPTTPKHNLSPQGHKGPFKSKALDALRNKTTKTKPMTDRNRLDFRREVRVAMADKDWDGARTCKEAGISVQTLAKVTQGKPISGISMFKLRQALELDKQGPSQPKQVTDYPADVELIRNSLGEWLTGQPAKERSAFLLDLFATIQKRGGTPPKLP